MPSDAEAQQEAVRLAALYELRLLDTSASESFDRITRMASRFFDLPSSAISLTDRDRQFFKSRIGIDQEGMPREGAPCAEVTESQRVVVLPDIAVDPAYWDSPLAKSGARFYAGAPLVTRDGFAIGALCVAGPEPRQATEGEIAMLLDMASMVMSQVELQHAYGRIEPLSGLPNRTQFVEDLIDLSRIQSGPNRRLVVFVDLASPHELSHGTRVMGPSFLDDLIKEAAAALRRALGPNRIAYMVGGHQIAFLAPPDVLELTYLDVVARTLSAIRAQATSRFVTTVSVGVVPYDVRESDPNDVLRLAHCAAQDARATDTKVSLYSSTQDALHRRRFDLINAFGAALTQPDQLGLVFQPRLDLATGRCISAEVLLRWNHPTLGAVSPAEFIPLVERTTLAKATTMWVLDAALHQLAAWSHAGADLKLSVNVSAGNLGEPDFADRVLETLARHGIMARSLELEVTESAVMEDAGHALRQLGQLAAAGVSLAIDDFGTGYSSLSYLQALPFNVVKIDRSFIAGCAGDARQQALVATMITLSHDLSYRVVAEGIECQSVADLLVGLGCDEGQGYLFARPMPDSDFGLWYETHALVQGKFAIAA